MLPEKQIKIEASYTNARRLQQLVALVVAMISGWLLVAVPMPAVGAPSQQPRQSAGDPRVTLADSINSAGRQRMLTQRITKAYCQIGLNVRTDEARHQLADAVTLFERQLAELKRSAPNQDVSMALKRVEERWAPFRATSEGAVTKEGAARLLSMDEDLLSAANQVVLSLQDAAGTPIGRLVNISGRQRMLSQRIAKFYLAKRWGLANAAVTEGLQQVTNEFKGALQELKATTHGSDAIRKGLDNAGVQWELMEYSLRNEDKPLEEFVALTSEKILIAMDQVTALYAEIR